MITSRSSSSSDEVSRLSGGKGRSLHVLSKNGLPVPEWAALGSDLLTQVLDSGLRETIQANQGRVYQYDRAGHP